MNRDTELTLLELLGLTTLFLAGIMTAFIMHPGWIVLTAVAIILAWVK